MIKSFTESFKHSEQEIFDFVAPLLIQQGNPSMSSDGGCVYENELGQHCAVGMLMSEDELKRVRDNGRNFSSVERITTTVFREEICLSEPAAACRLQWLRELQRVHDVEYNWDHRAGGIQTALANFAAANDLNADILDQPKELA